MSPSDRTPVTLVAHAEPGTDIFIIDSQFRIVARGVRRVEQSLPPGIYKVKCQAGSAVREEHVVLEPGAAVREVRCAPLAFQSSAPLAGTRATHEYHMANAATLSRQVHVADGAGAKIFIFARVWTDPSGRDSVIPPPPPGQHPATGLTLHDVTGRLVADLQQMGQADVAASDPWSGCTIELAPGPYRLRVEVPDIGVLEQIVIAPPGWQVQVFLLQGNYGSPRSPIYRADLASASILLARATDGFDPHNDSLHLTELARNALTRQRGVIARDLLTQLLGAKYENPMLGLYGAHALAVNPEPDRPLLTQVVQRLRGMLGPHPDVDALALQLGDLPSQAYEVPPMLRRSWSIVVEHAAHRRDLVPRGSLASRASTAIWGESAWLIWTADAISEPVESSTGLEENLEKIRNIAATFDSPEGDVARNPDLDDVEQTMMSYVVRRAKYRGRTRQPALLDAGPAGPDAAAPGGAAAPAPSTADDASQLAQALGLPPSTVEQKMAVIVRKLGG